MRYLALATDYDGTIATGGVLSSDLTHALERLRASGRKLILVTGRELSDLISICPHIGLFDRVVAENGALLFDPHTAEESLLAAPPPPVLAERLKNAGVWPLSIGRVVISALCTQKHIVVDTIQRLGLELQIILNKEWLMVLPFGVDKATGLLHALQALDLAPASVAGIGDAENDRAFLAICGCAVSVANALPELKNCCDLVLAGEAGEGAIELIDRLLANDLSDVPARQH
jgi:hydroxymethylpyrimidine pyrophosphatase-like HAD family hydrolase